MPSVKYVDLGLGCVADYWRKIVEPAVESLTTYSPRVVMDAASSLWHLHEWVWHERNPGKNASGPEFDAFRKDLIARCPELALLRDIADAGKHRGLARASVQVVGHRVYDAPVFGLIGVPDNTHYSVILEDDRHLDFEQVIFDVVVFWKLELRYELTPPPDVVTLFLTSRQTQEDIEAQSALLQLAADLPGSLLLRTSADESIQQPVALRSAGALKGLQNILDYVNRVRKAHVLLARLRKQFGPLPPQLSWTFLFRARNESLAEISKFIDLATNAATLDDVVSALERG